MSFFISDEYTYLPGRECLGNYIYPSGEITLEAAKEACANNTECGCIKDNGCHGQVWYLFEGDSYSSSGSGTCAWIKSESRLTISFPREKTSHI